jgi:DNA-directed RNA polymerase subunit beta'
MSIDIDYIQIEMANPETIERWSKRELADGTVVGEILKADTINYRTFKPERGGLFCERIFGSVISGECACGKTRRRLPLDIVARPQSLDEDIQPNAIRTESQVVCPHCGVEPTDSKVRRYRLAAIRLRKPVAHLWYFRNTPNVMSILLNVKVDHLQTTVQLGMYTPATPSAINYCLPSGYMWFSDEWESFHTFFGTVRVGNKPKGICAPWNKHGHFLYTWPQTIENCGASALAYIFKRFDLLFIARALTYRLRLAVAAQKAEEQQKRTRWILQPDTFKPELELSRTGQRHRGIGTNVKILAKRLQCVRLLLRKEFRPEWMLISLFPVLPPDLRPMVQLANGRFAASDLNDLYRRLIYRKLRFDKFCAHFKESQYMPDLLVRHDLCLLQEAADAIIDNGRLQKPVLRPNKQPLKSLTAIIEGKQGRFRLNLLGKRVDYSGRSVIVVGPKLRLHQCGLPREMALELFYPFVIRALLQHSIVKNIRVAKARIQQRDQSVWDILERVVSGHPILLNRAPTLHRLGIQAFEPILLAGRAIQLHPLVCPAFNADFDGDQMAVHIPLSLEAQAEARLLMLATHNWLSPATGEPSIVPSQDMILGFYYLTARKPARPIPPTPTQPLIPQKWNVFTAMEMVLQRYALGQLTLHDMVWVRWPAPTDTASHSPLEIHVYPSGHVRCVYDGYVAEQLLFHASYDEHTLPLPADYPTARSVQVLDTSISTMASLPTDTFQEFEGVSLPVNEPYTFTPSVQPGMWDSQTRHVTARQNLSQPVLASSVVVGAFAADGELMRQLPMVAPVPTPQTIYIRTTPGRLLLNHLIYENLFL